MRLHKPFRECLGCGSLPKLGYSHGDYEEYSIELPYPVQAGDRYEAFVLYCPGCSFRVGPFMDVQAVITAWHTANYPNCPFRLQCWQNRFERQLKAANTQIREAANT